MRAFQPVWPKISAADQTWRSMRQAHQALHVEIGAGVGLHAIQLARENPDIFVVALERTQEKSDKLLRRVAHHQPLPNLLAIRADAIQWIWQNLSAHEVAEYYVLYPNPHPKAKQANQRWLRMPFFEYLIKTLSPTGCLTLATNEAFYFEEACEFVRDPWKLNLLKAGPLPVNFAGRTHFERKYLARGETCYQVVLSRFDRSNSLDISMSK